MFNTEKEDSIINGNQSAPKASTGELVEESINDDDNNRDNDLDELKPQHIEIAMNCKLHLCSKPKMTMINDYIN